MYNNEELINKLASLVGFEADDRFGLSAFVKDSTTGISVNDDYPVLSAESMLAAYPEVGIDGFSEWMEERKKAAIKSALLDFNNLRLESKSGKVLQGEHGLFNRDGRPEDTITPSGRFVGYRVRLTKFNIAAVLSRVGVQFDAPQQITLYVYHTQKKEPVLTEQVQYSNVGRFEYFDLTQEKPLIMTDGYYLIGYFEDELDDNVKAINTKVRIFKDGGCGYCNKTETIWRSRWRPFIDVQPIAISEGLPDSYNNWIAKPRFNVVDEDTNFGLNLTFSFKCDLTVFLMRNSSQLIQIVKTAWQHKLMLEVAQSKRQNADQSQQANIAANFAYDLENAENTHNKYQRALKNAEFNLSDVSELCRPPAASLKIEGGVL